jgi:uncharacterized protein YcnI
MMVRVRLLVSALAALALLTPPPAAAHLTTEPSFLAAGSTELLVVTVHNDRDEAMTGFRLTVPTGLRILDAGGEEGWTAAVEGASSTWTGGELAPVEPVVFEVEIQAAGVEPGVVDLQGDQLYADGEAVSWPVPLTVVPPGGETEAALNGQAIATLSILGVLVVATFGLVVWQRRRRTLEE